MSNTNTPRTRLQWFAMFPEPYKSQAIENYDESYRGSTKYTTFLFAVWALEYGFDLEKSPQGWKHWAEFMNKLFVNEITLTVPEEEVEATPDYEAIVKELVEWLEENIELQDVFESANSNGMKVAYLNALSFIKSKTESK